jgi:ABC-2 type transport system ATP-binding protein
MTNAIVTHSLCKQFPVGEDRMTAFKRVSKLIRGIYTKPQRLDVLSNINLEIPRGSKIALLGNNGSGKSTLLRSLAGIYAPTRGSVTIEGTIMMLSGWGIGQLDKLTVRQNVYLLGAIYGLFRHEIDQVYHDIISWAELEQFESNQLFTLSTGMKTRLAFSTTRHVDSDICLLDEAFSAGDQNFHKKCKAHFEQSRHKDRTYIIATHHPEALGFFCTQAAWIRQGRIEDFGPFDDVVANYQESKRS